MISSIDIKNYQSHKESFFEFSHGLNIITGSSDSGKTSVLRALNWTINNRPNSLSYISYWNRDKKKQPKEDTSVIIKRGTKDYVTRKRTKDFNGYEISTSKGSNTLEAIGTDVPEEIQKLFNVSDVNIQRQFDQPFLLSESSAEVARFLNKTINLNVIDRVLGKAELERRRVNQDIVKNTEDQKEVQEQLESLNWISAAEIELKKIERRQERIDEKFVTKKSLEKIIVEIPDIITTLNYCEKIIKTEPLVLKVQKLQKEVKEKYDDVDNLSWLIKDYNDNSKIIKSTPDFTGAEMLMQEISEFDEQIDEKSDIVAALTFNINSYLNTQTESFGLEKIIENLEEQLPTLCPTCGQPFPKGHRHG